MKYEDLEVGMKVYDPLSSLGYGEVVRICKKTVWVQFLYYNNYPREKTIYDLEHLQFLEKAP